MRRKDREVTDKARINKIIDKCYCCRLGFCDNGKVYIVPLNFGYVEQDGQYIFYFHSAKEGRKIELIKSEQYAGFEMDTNYRIKEADIACDYSATYQSVIGEGKVEIINENDEKTEALLRIMNHNAGHGKWEFSKEALEKVMAFKLVVANISCKEHN